MVSKSFATTLRQSGLVMGSGPGSLTVLKDGRTALLPGVDSWFVSQRDNRQKIPQDAVIFDRLLAENLRVKHFVAPPADGIEGVETSTNGVLGVTIFPKWTVCTNAGCGAMMRISDSALTLERCQQCLAGSKGKGWKTVQTNFLVACEDGHLAEFPWLEWVHKGPGNICANPKLRFTARGISELGKQTARCSCGKYRSLAQTNEVTDSGNTALSERLAANGEHFLCNGDSPWLGVPSSECNKPIRMLLRNQSNLYFASTVSSILIPDKAGDSSVLGDLISKTSNNGKYKALKLKGHPIAAIATVAKMEDPQLEPFDLEEIEQALELELSGSLPREDGQPASDGAVQDRTPEWDALRRPVESGNLVVRDYGWEPHHFDGIVDVLAVPLLKKTTALQGFSRVFPKSVGGLKGKSLLRRNPHSKSQTEWLPAVQHQGEGIMVILDPERVERWEARQEVTTRTEKLRETLAGRGTEATTVPPRFILLHTLSHLVIQQLVFECGYTSASLGERIYSQGNQSGFLVYTASSAGDGTMGGLVEMAEPIRFARVVEQALAAAEWCSNDPICMESGVSTGGNRHGGNLAACFNCCLIPETACDHFNSGLDRALIVGDHGDTSESLKFFI